MTKDPFLVIFFGTKWPLCADVTLNHHSLTRQNLLKGKPLARCLLTPSTYFLLFFFLTDTCKMGDIAFVCPVTENCIDSTQVCNFKEDCLGGEDESPDCGEYLSIHTTLLILEEYFWKNINHKLSTGQFLQTWVNA